MKTKIFIIILIVITNSCSTPAYLPSSDKIDVNEHGSYIELYQKNKIMLDGELIALDSNQIVILTGLDKNCAIVPMSEVKKFRLEYAKPKHYGWIIPLGIFLPLIHGYYSVLTLPAHLLVTIAVTVSGENAFTYSSKTMTFDELKMFARFPQGIPPGIELAGIK